MNIENGIAIIGMSGRFPGAIGVKSFWENLCQKRESISTFSDEELLQHGISQNQIKSSSYIKARGILENVEDFDADFFSIPFAEAQLMDPQHRHFLECSWEALEDAGYNPECYHGKIGVFGGASRSTYFLNHLHSNPNVYESAKQFLCRTGNENDCLTTRVSYKLNLKGPSLSVQTACSSALVAVCIACNHLLRDQCDMAIAGGASIYSPQQSGYTYLKEMIFSPDGHCRPFDVSAKGTVPGNGVGIVVLKKLESAIADKDHIYAVIRGYAINNDGHEKMGFSAPSVQGQADAITSAIKMAGIDPVTIKYIEAHGTGTAIGDPIEIKALSTALIGLNSCDKVKCCIGAVKSNIGHLMEASGVAGLIKASLALKNQKIPPTVHFTELNPHIDFMDETFYINSEIEEWKESSWPRRAGVSAFGFGGTNAHVILEEGPRPAFSDPLNKPQILPISAKTPQALDILTIQLGKFLQENSHLTLSDVAYTLQKGRKEWKFRKAFVCNDIQQAISFLLDKDPRPSNLDNQEKTKLNYLAKSWISGNSIDWETLHVSEQPSRVSLPTYPFEKKRCWIEPFKEKWVENDQQSKNHIAAKNDIEEIEEKLIIIWKTLLGCKTIERKDNFFDLGGESLLALELLNQIEKILNVTLPLQSLYQAPTITQLAHVILLKAPSYLSSIIELKKGDAELPLFMIHPIHGTIFCYEQLIRKMNFNGKIFGIQANETSEDLATIEEIASFYIQEIKQIQRSGPYLIFGASFGGLIAYEIACQLNERGDSVALLAMLDIVNPSFECVKKDTLIDMLIHLLQLFEKKEGAVALESRLSEEELFDRISLSMGLNIWEKKQREEMKKRIKRYLLAIQRYEPKLYDGEIIFFEMKEQYSNTFESPLWESWKSFAKQGIKSIFLEGNHQNMLQSEDLAKHLELQLSNIWRKS